MKLMTKEIARKLPRLYATDNVELADKVCIVKFFTPWSNWTWYVVEGELQEDGDYRFFGRVDGHESEWGYFMLGELSAIKGRFDLGVERDLHFGDCKLPVAMMEEA